MSTIENQKLSERLQAKHFKAFQKRTYIKFGRNATFQEFEDFMINNEKLTLDQWIDKKLLKKA